jgi:hypothetical protein
MLEQEKKLNVGGEEYKHKKGEKMVLVRLAENSSCEIKRSS